MSVVNKDNSILSFESEKFEKIRFRLKITFFNLYINPLLKINFSINKIIKFNDNNLSSSEYFYKNNIAHLKESHTNQNYFNNHLFNNKDNHENKSEEIEEIIENTSDLIANETNINESQEIEENIKKDNETNINEQNISQSNVDYNNQSHKMSLDMSTGLYVSDEYFNISEYGQYEIIFHINLFERNSGKFCISFKENIFVSVPFFVSAETEDNSNIVEYGSSIKISCISPNHLNDSHVYFKLFDSSFYLLKKDRIIFSSDEIIFYHKFTEENIIFPGTIIIFIEVEDPENGIFTIRELKNIRFKCQFEVENYSFSNSFKDVYSLKIIPKIVSCNNINLYIPHERARFILKLTSLSHYIETIEGIPISYDKHIYSYLFNFKVSETIDFILDFNFILCINYETNIKMNIKSPFSNKKLILSQLKTNLSSTSSSSSTEQNIKYKVKHGDNFTISFFVLDSEKHRILNILHCDIFVSLLQDNEIIKRIKCIQRVNGIFECNVLIDSYFSKGLVSTSISVFNKTLSTNEIYFDIITNISFSLLYHYHHHILTIYSECISDEHSIIYGGNFEYYIYDMHHQYIMKLKSSREHNLVSLPYKYTPCHVILKYENHDNILTEIFIERRSFFRYFVEEFDIEYIFILISFTLFTFSIYLRYHF